MLSRRQNRLLTKLYLTLFAAAAAVCLLLA